MPINNRIADLAPEITRWRRHLHETPELLYDVHRTAGFVAEQLRAFGCDDVVAGIGRTGVVGVIKGRLPAPAGGGVDGVRTIGLRADMDALPITEDTGLPYASKTPGKMHACGHDGHTAMLLGAARYLTETRNFAGTVALIFQPAEEGGAGGKAMVDEGMMERFGIDAVYGMHNQPGMPLGHFGLRTGPMLAASDMLTITIDGKGGHAAKPHKCIDTVLVAAHIITALQSIPSRNVDPLEASVISICMVSAGNAGNVIPDRVVLSGTVRSLKAGVRDLLEERITALCQGVAASLGARAVVDYHRGYPVTSNHAREAAFAAKVAADLAGQGAVDAAITPVMGGEDFSFMLEARPGAFIFMGNGDTAGLHHPKYDFNDAAIPHGVSFWAKLVETALPA